MANRPNSNSNNGGGDQRGRGPAGNSKRLRVKKPVNKKKRLTIILSSVLAVVILLCGVGYALLHTNLFGGADITEYSSPKKIQDKSVNILVCGIDNDSDPAAEHTENELTDVIMIVNFNFEKSEATILQIPRDTYIGSDYPSGKVNAVYAHGDNQKEKIKNLVGLLNDQFSLPIDHYVTITMETFREAIDAIGGIDMNVPYQIDYSPGEGFVIPAGQQKLTGQQAEWFVRWRDGYAEGDIGRVKAQRLFVSAAMEELTTLNSSQMIKLVKLCYDKVETDLTMADILAYAQEASKLDLAKVEMYMVPGEPTYSDDGLSIYGIHKDELADLLNQKFRPHTDDVLAENLNVIEVSHDYDYYDQNGNSIQDLLNGHTPGKDSLRDREDTASGTGDGSGEDSSDTGSDTGEE